MAEEVKDIWDFPVHSQRHEICYTSESIRHPAKMELNLCREIIKRYSNPGDLILDPMAGIGSTIIEGMILGRNVIGVEYEEKFCKMAEANITIVKEKFKFMKSLGKSEIIKGDSRELRKVLANGGLKIIFPTDNPFANTLAGSSEDDITKFKHGSAGKDYGNNPENVGNLPYHQKVELSANGAPDGIIFSPPFADTEAFQDKEFRDKNIPQKNASISYSESKDDKKQVANLDYKPLEKGGENITESIAPFSNVTMEKKPSENWQGPDFSQQVYNTNKEDKNQIGNLHYNGIVDSVIMSPPYSEAIQRGGGISEEGHNNDPTLANRQYVQDLATSDLSKLKERAEKFSKKYQNKRNVMMEAYLSSIGDIRYKNNYGETWHIASEYSLNKSNIGNLSHGNVDSVITSPPYEAAIDSKRHVGEIVEREKDKGGLGNFFQGYSTDEENIGNFKGQTYLEAMMMIYQECYSILKPEGFMVLVTKNFVRAGKQIRLDEDTIKLCQKAGFLYLRRHYRKIKSPSFWIINAIQKWEKKHPDIPHPYPLFEDVLVFRKELQKEPERERELIQSCSAPRLQTNFQAEQTNQNSEIREIGKQNQNTQRIQKTSGISSIIFSPPYAETNQGKIAFQEHDENCSCPYCSKCKCNAGEVQGIRYSNDKLNIGNLKY